MSDDQPEQWTEGLSQSFLEHGRYFIPDRKHQIDLISALLPDSRAHGAVFDLGCGAGLLSEAILIAHQNLSAWGLDNSEIMLAAASRRLAVFGRRFKAVRFDLARREWPEAGLPLQAVVSSLAIHHLDGPGKAALFKEIYTQLAPGGALVIADLLLHASPAAAAAWADEWDSAVRENAQALDGDLSGFEAFERAQWNTYRYPIPPDDIDQPSTLVEQLRWLSAAGFGGVDVFWLRAGHAVFGGYKPEDA